MYSMLRVVLVGAGLLAAYVPAAAAEDDAEALDKQPTVLLQTQLELEKNRLEESQTQSNLIKAELQRIQASLRKVDEARFDEKGTAADVEDFKKKFQEVLASAKQGQIRLDAYQDMQQHRTKLLRDSSFGWYSPRTGDSPFFIEELYDYGNDRERAGGMVILDGLRPLDDAETASEQSQMKAAVERAAGFVSNLSVETVKRVFEDDQRRNKRFLQDATERANTAITLRKTNAEQAMKRIGEISEQLEKRQQKGEKDSILTWAIFIMIGVVVALYLGTLWFNQDIQTLIFQQRTLVELIGMAFLLLTIIILGTGEKIERSVLGTLLGTVAGYIFGQQMRSAQKPETQQQAGAQNAQQANARVGGVAPPAEALQRAVQMGDPVQQENALLAKQAEEEAKKKKSADGSA